MMQAVITGSFKRQIHNKTESQSEIITTHEVKN